MRDVPWPAGATGTPRTAFTSPKIGTTRPPTAMNACGSREPVTRGSLAGSGAAAGGGVGGGSGTRASATVAGSDAAPR